MNNSTSILSNNIRFLRKKKGLSQEQLASSLSLKRSSIAAYESKNVEPRLRIAMHIAKYFDISIRELLSTRLTENTDYSPFERELQHVQDNLHVDVNIESDTDIEHFVEKSENIKKILEGLKTFYEFKKKDITSTNPEVVKLFHDNENLMELMEHLISYNELLINSLHRAK